MNKQEELAALAAFVASLPRASYLAQWLHEVSPQIASDIRNDIFPTAAPAEMRQQCAAMLNDAKTEAAAILARATKDADRIAADSSAKRDAFHAALARHKARMISEIEKL